MELPVVKEGREKTCTFKSNLDGVPCNRTSVPGYRYCLRHCERAYKEMEDSGYLDREVQTTPSEMANVMTAAMPVRKGGKHVR